MRNQPSKATKGRPTIREIEVLHALIDWRKTTSAAQRLGWSQPAVSRLLAQLEHKVGRSLFRREGGRLHATPEGLRLYQLTQPVLNVLDRLDQAVSIATDEPLRIIAPATLGTNFLPSLVASFLSAQPGLDIQFESGTSVDVLAQVADGNVDLGIVDSQASHPSLKLIPFRRAILHVVLRADDPLALRKVLSPEDLADKSLVALSRRFQTRGAVERAFLDAQIEFKIAAEVSTTALAVELVRNGVGVSIINPFPMASVVRDTELRFVPFMPELVLDSVFVLSDFRPASSGAMLFMKHVFACQTPDSFSQCLGGLE
jgi:DNA-binding transcriptional LysR family regulator